MKENAGFWQCNLCARYTPTKETMGKHLALCVNPIKRRAYDKHVYPMRANGRERCPVCRYSVKAGFTMGAHIVKKHAEDVAELWNWGYDYELLREQFNKKN